MTHLFNEYCLESVSFQIDAGGLITMSFELKASSCRTYSGIHITVHTICEYNNNFKDRRNRDKKLLGTIFIVIFATDVFTAILVLPFNMQNKKE